MKYLFDVIIELKLSLQRQILSNDRPNILRFQKYVVIFMDQLIVRSITIFWSILVDQYLHWSLRSNCFLEMSMHYNLAIQSTRKINTST